MARGSDINQRIVLTGADEVRRHLDEIAASGQRAGNQTRAALIAATQGAQGFTAGTRGASASTGQLRFALQNLTFQVNDVATSLASGGDVMRVFAQQGGQVFQAFQQGGGFGTVMRAAGAGIASLITPTTAAIAAFAAFAVGVGVLVERAQSAQQSTKQFDALLRITGRSGGTTGKELEAAAESLHDVGVSTSEAREQFRKFIGEGGLGSQAPKIVRIGAELNRVFGEGSMQSFVDAAKNGGPALEEWARKLGIVTGVSKEVQQQLDAAAQSANSFRNSINEALLDQRKGLADLARTEKRAQEDRDRQKSQLNRGRSPEQQQEENDAVEHGRRLEDINRDTALRINAIIAARNEENAKQLAAFNKAIEDAAQQSADKQSIVAQAGQKVLGSTKELSSGLQQALLDLSTAWNNLADTIAQSSFIQQILTDFITMINSIKDAIGWLDKLTNALKQVPALPTFLGGPGEPQRFAAGGLVRGPGTGTSDSIPARLSAGEYVMPAAAVQRFGAGFFESLRMNMPAMPRARIPRGFAAGGLVAASAGGTPVHIHLGGQTFQLAGENAVVGALTRAARRSAMLSAGRKPSTA